MVGLGMSMRPSHPPKNSVVPRTSMTIKLETRLIPKNTRGPALSAGTKIRKAKRADANPAIGIANQKEIPAFVTNRAEV